MIFDLIYISDMNVQMEKPNIGNDAFDLAGGLASERARSAELSATNQLLQSIVAGSRALLDAPEFEPALNEWLKMMCIAQGATSAAFYDVVFHAEAGRQTLRALAEWAPPESKGRGDHSFDQPIVIDPRGGEEAFDVLEKGCNVAVHVDELEGAAKEHVELQGHTTTIIAPIMDGAKWIGAISFDYWERKEQNLQDDIILKTAADSLASVLKRNEVQATLIAEQKLRAEMAETAARDLKRRSDLLEAVVAASDIFLRAQSVSEVGQKVVEQIGLAMCVDRMVLGRFLPPSGTPTDGWIEFIFEWTSPDTPRQTDDPALRLFDTTPYPEFLCPLKSGHPVAVVTEDFVDPVARAEQEATGALSQYHYPIMVDGVLWGTIGGDDCKRPRRFDAAEISTLQLVASALGSLIKREQLTEARLAAERELAEEKARMAREIHDTLAQGFTGVIMQLHATEDALEVRDDKDAQRHVSSALNRARYGLAEARRSVYALRPPLLDDGDLAGALQMVARHIFDGVDIEATVEIFGHPEALPEAIMVELFRIGQEAMGNALRHANARRLTLQLDYRDEEACALTIRDDGQGFDPNSHRNVSGFGLISMRERAERLGADLSIRSALGAGTTIGVIAPRKLAPSPGLSGGLPKDLS